MTEEAFISIGSNIDPEAHISKALEQIAHRLDLTALSTFYWSEPIGRPEQPRFLNGVAAVRVALTPRELKFGVLRPIEGDLGRIRTEDGYAPRVIDLDILLYGEAVIDEPGLRIPDPDIRSRPFLAAPLLDLAPGLLMPDHGEPLSAIVEALDQGNLIPATRPSALWRERWCP
ncbi:MAG TPA: 2-amino-4-hydroxy-6-hydroxymethyldihydropteridine diphosphokinase [Candidatus Hydrogenedentes bacterium]|nr:2-amino-4-hydroxy-6-hydroxymethyldihydropteridine diphosphokinase [Candidatus Hydrogenedentota bacterium]